MLIKVQIKLKKPIRFKVNKSGNLVCLDGFRFFKGIFVFLFIEKRWVVCKVLDMETLRPFATFPKYSIIEAKQMEWVVPNEED